jgi:hypothetical protein
MPSTSCDVERMFGAACARVGSVSNLADDHGRRRRDERQRRRAPSRARRSRAGLDAIGVKEYTAYTSTCYDARSLARSDQHRRRDARRAADRARAARSPPSRTRRRRQRAARRRREARRQARSQNGHTRDAMIVTVGNPTFAARVAGIVPCRRRSSFASSARATQRSSWTRT